jgi:DNA-directed RNA polymerase subunit L
MAVSDVKIMNVVNAEELSFEIADADVCIINAMRRVLLSEVPSLVFRGFPHKDNKINIIKNNSKFNNEYIKHRIQCIPIFMSDPSQFELITTQYQLRLNVANNTNNLIYVTSDQFVLYKKGSDKPLPDSDKQIRKMFPADPISGGNIPICCLRPRIADIDDVEEIQMILDFSIGISKEDACWNVVTKCCFENKKDDDRFARILKKEPKAVEAHFKTQAEIDNYMRIEMSPEEIRDFEIIESQRVFIPNHFIMYVQSVGIYSNEYLISFAANYMIRRLDEFNSFLSTASIKNVCFNSDNYCLSRDTTTLKKVITLYVKQDDYTMGKIIEKYLYYMTKKEVFYVSFKKEHPHDTHSLVLFCYKNPDTTDEDVIGDLRKVTMELTRIYKVILSEPNFRY